MTTKNAKKGVSLSVLGAVLLGTSFTMSATAQPKFDKTIADAAADQVAKKLGAIRDGFELDEEVVIVSPELFDGSKLRDPVLTNSIRSSNATQVKRPSRHHYQPASKRHVRVVYTGTIIEN